MDGLLEELHNLDIQKNLLKKEYLKLKKHLKKTI